MIQFDTVLEPLELLDILRETEFDPTRRDEFKRLLRTQPEPVVDAAFEEASRDERLEFLRLMPVERAATTFTDLPLSTQADYLPDLAADRLRVMGAFIGPDEVADLLGELGDDPRRDYLLNSLPLTLAKSAKELERYDEDEAGGIMTPEYVALREGTTVTQAIAFLRQAVDHAETVTNLYLVNAQGQLTGVIQLQSLVTAAPNARVDDLARREIIFAKTDTDQEEVARLMRDYDLAVLPVVDSDGILKGIITIDDVLDVVQEEATEDIYKGVAMEGSEIDYLRASPWSLWRKRVLWLAALSISEFLTVSVSSQYGDLLRSQAVLSFYTAALIGTGGNTGSQSAVLVIRAIAQGQVRGRDTLRVLSKEFGTGLMLGVTLGAFAFVRVSLLQRAAGVGIALAVSLAVVAIVLVANLLGAMLPILFTKLKIDPAVTSSPFLATLMDATGLLIYFNIAKFVLHL
jgi:magnesium transporter